MVLEMSTYSLFHDLPVGFLSEHFVTMSLTEAVKEGRAPQQDPNMSPSVMTRVVPEVD